MVFLKDSNLGVVTPIQNKQEDRWGSLGGGLMRLEEGQQDTPEEDVFPAR